MKGDREKQANKTVAILNITEHVMIVHEVHLWKGTIVPDVPMIREAVVDKADLAFLHILLYWVELFPKIDLRRDNTVHPYNFTTFTFTSCTSQLPYQHGNWLTIHLPKC